MFHEYKEEAKHSQKEKLHRMSGGSTATHPDEKEDRALVKKMVKRTSLTGKKDGGKTPLTRQKRADGGRTSNSNKNSKSDKQKPTMHTTIVISPHSKGQAGPQGIGSAPMRPPVGPSVPPSGGLPSGGLPPQLMQGLASALGGQGMQPQGPMKKGGKVSKGGLTPIKRHKHADGGLVTNRSGKAYTAGAGSGEGRLEKIYHQEKHNRKDY